MNLSRSLDHPFKRAAFVFFVGAVASLLVMAVVPTPVNVQTSHDWHDATGTRTADREVMRIETACAGRKLGDLETFARDYFIVDSLTDSNPYGRFMTEDTLARGEKFSIAESIDVTEEQRVAAALLVSSPAKPCLGRHCVLKLDRQTFESVLRDCSRKVAQYKQETSTFKLRIIDNLVEKSPWSVIALLAAIGFLLASVLYNRVLRPLVTWVRQGSRSA